MGLNATGRLQARRIRQILQKENVSRVYVSTRKRTIDFAGLAFANRQLLKIASLREMCFGIFEGMTHYGILHKYPDTYRMWIDDWKKCRVPGAEDYNVFTSRVRRALRRIISDSKGKTVAIVTHGGPLRVMLEYLTGLKSEDIIWPRSGECFILQKDGPGTWVFKHGKDSICLRRR